MAILSLTPESSHIIYGNELPARRWSEFSFRAPALRCVTAWRRLMEQKHDEDEQSVVCRPEVRSILVQFHSQVISLSFSSSPVVLCYTPLTHPLLLLCRVLCCLPLQIFSNSALTFISCRCSLCVLVTSDRQVWSPSPEADKTSLRKLPEGFKHQTLAANSKL